MKILSVTIKNINSLRLEQTIDFTQPPLSNTGLFAITGDTGAGKTTILDAITLALYGKVHRNKDVKEVLSYGSVESLAEVTFESHTGRYRSKWTIWRARKKADGAIQQPVREVAQWNAEKEAFEIIAERIKEVDQTIEEVTGLDYDRFCRSVLLSQGDFAAFLRASEKERSDLLERITGTSIYSELSMAAYERSKKEQQKLDQLQSNLELITGTDQEEVALADREKEKEEKTKARDELREQMGSTRTSIQQLEKQKALEEAQQKLEKDQVTLNQLLKEESVRFNALEQYEKTSPLLSELGRLDATNQQLHSLEEELEALNRSIEDRKSALKTSQEVLVEKERARTEQLNEQQRLQPIFKQVTELDHTIKAAAAQQQNIAKTVATNRRRLEGLEKTLEQQQKEQATIVNNIKEADQWLQEHHHLAQLPDDLPRIEHLKDTMRSILKQQNSGKNQVKTLKKQEKDLLDQQKQYQKQLQQAEKAMDKLTADFQAAVPKQFAADRWSLLELLDKDIDQLREEREHLDQFKKLVEQYQQQVEELSALEEELESLRAEELTLSKEVMNFLEQEEELVKRLEVKQARYDRERSIANYEKDRSQLKPGDPCPLCGAVHHPYLEDHQERYIDDAKEEVEAAKSRLDSLRQKTKPIVSRYQQIVSETQRLSGDEREALTGELDRRQVQLQQQEVVLAQHFSKLPIIHFETTRSQLLQQQLEALEHKLKDQKISKTKLQELHRTLEKEERGFQKLEQAAAQLSSEQQVITVKLEDTQTRLQEQATEFDKSTKAINKLLQPYDLVFDLKTAKAMFQQLEAWKENFTANRQRQADQEKALAVIAQAITGQSRQIQELKATLDGEEKQLHAANEELAQLRSEREELFGTEDVGVASEALANKVETVQQIFEAAKEACRTIENEQVTLQKQEQQAKTQLKKTKEQSKKLTQKLEQKATVLGFTNLQAVLDVQLEPEEASVIKQRRDQLNNQQTELASQAKTIEHQLKELQKKELPEETLEVLEAQLEREEHTFSALQQQLGALQQLIDDEHKRQKKAKDLLRQVEAQKKEQERWAQLNAVIGSADGKKFRVFAQGLTLRRLVQLANQHLKRLDGRYHIEKRTDNELELDIIDTYQADNRRSMRTLSGGESFLVSLALALGLSDLAGRHANIQSLFIDEGFGTLDENSLDLALSTLENLQSGGKTIGVISHVKALKERIAIQIVVHKKGNGVSEVEVG